MPALENSIDHNNSEIATTALPAQPKGLETTVTNEGVAIGLTAGALACALIGGYLGKRHERRSSLDLIDSYREECDLMRSRLDSRAPLSKHNQAFPNHAAFIEGILKQFEEFTESVHDFYQSIAEEDYTSESKTEYLKDFMKKSIGNDFDDWSYISKFFISAASVFYDNGLEERGKVCTEVASSFLSMSECAVQIRADADWKGEPETILDTLDTMRSSLQSSLFKLNQQLESESESDHSKD